MVGCINPRKTALELAGFENKEDWQAAVHKLNSKLKEAERMLKENAKAEKRAAKKKGDADGENPADAGDDVQVGLVTLETDVENLFSRGVGVGHRHFGHVVQASRTQVVKARRLW